MLKTVTQRRLMHAARARTTYDDRPADATRQDEKEGGVMVVPEAAAFIVCW